MRKMQEYKQTEIGKIPKDWEIVKLIDVVDNKQAIVAGPFGSNLKVIDYEPTGVPIIRLQNIERNKFVNKDIKYVSPKKAKELSYHSYQPGDLVLAKLGDPIGKTCIVPPTIKKGIVVADVVRIRISQQRAIKNFIEYMLNWSICAIQLRKETIGSTRPRVNISQVRNLKIPLPPLPEQKKIAEVLSTVDQGIGKADEAIEKTQRLKKGLMQELLTQGIGHKAFKETEIGRIPERWKLICLKEVAEVRYGLGQPPPQNEKGIPMIRATNIKQGRITANDMMRINREDIPKTRNPFLKEGDVIVVRSGAYTGDIGYITKIWEGTIAGYDLVVSPSNRILSLFLSNWLLSRNIQCEYFFKFKERSAQPHLNSSQVENTPIPLPPLPEQKMIAEILSTVDERLELLRKRKEKLQRIKQGLMNDLLTGRKRVRVEV